MPTAACQTSSWRSLCCKGGITAQVATEISHNCSCSNQSSQPAALRWAGSSLGLPLNTTNKISCYMGCSVIPAEGLGAPQRGGGDSWEQEWHWPSQGNLPAAAAESDPSHLGKEIPCPKFAVRAPGSLERMSEFLSCSVSPLCHYIIKSAILYNASLFFSFMQHPSVHQLLYYMYSSKAVKWNRNSVSNTFIREP